MPILIVKTEKEYQFFKCLFKIEINYTLLIDIYLNIFDIILNKNMYINKNIYLINGMSFIVLTIKLIFPRGKSFMLKSLPGFKISN